MSEKLRKICENSELNEQGCWLWQKSTTRGGYGRMRAGGKMRLAHRVAYEAFVGPIPEGLHVLHRCDVPGCVNPDHLWLGTNEDNMRDRNQKGRQSRGEKHSAKMREFAPRGDRNGSRTRPDRLARGNRHGRYTNPERTARGERNGRAKLTAAQVEEIRARYAAGGASQTTLGQEFGVSRPQISRIVHYKIWREDSSSQG